MGLGDSYASFPEHFWRNSSKEIALLLKKNFFNITYFVTSLFTKETFELSEFLMHSGCKACLRCVFQTLLFCLVHLLSVYICLNQDSWDLFVLFFKKLYSFSFCLYVYILSWIHFSMWVEIEARIFVIGWRLFSWLSSVDTSVKSS